jgi:putative endonuclease
METKISYFYVLCCKDGSFYGGYTTNLSRREKEHNDGIGAKYTKPSYRRPLKMIYAEGFSSRSAATKAEYAFKKQSRAKKVQFLQAAGVEFPLNPKQKCLVNLDGIEEESSNAKSKELSG